MVFGPVSVVAGTIPSLAALFSWNTAWHVAGQTFSLFLEGDLQLTHIYIPTAMSAHWYRASPSWARSFGHSQL